MLRRALMGLVRGYQLMLSPWLGASCRFYPTCSAYALQALERHGAAAGSYLTVRRLCRCQPWCEGGADPVPADPPRLFSRFTAQARPARAASTSNSESSP
nr:membrane protein insertion efficiency factor YidD [Caldimonas brevitalea]